MIEVLTGLFEVVLLSACLYMLVVYCFYTGAEALIWRAIKKAFGGG